MTDNSEIKIVYVLLDGVGDLPHPDIDNKTPLQAANSVRRIAEVNDTISESKVTQHVKLEQQQTSASRD